MNIIIIIKGGFKLDPWATTNYIKKGEVKDSL